MTMKVSELRSIEKRSVSQIFRFLYINCIHYGHKVIEVFYSLEFSGL